MQCCDNNNMHSKHVRVYFYFARDDRMAKMADATSAFRDRSRTTSAVNRRASLNKQSSVPDSGGSQYFSPGDRRFSGTEGRWSSPLKQFGLAKEKISKAFGRLSEQLTKSEAFLKEIKSAKQQNVAQLGLKVKGIKDVLARDQMKVVFFGRTSNGKSTVINALLQDRVLPMGIGHTTNCFCSVAGTEEGEGYLVISETAEKQAVEVCAVSVRMYVGRCVCICVHVRGRRGVRERREGVCVNRYSWYI